MFYAMAEVLHALVPDTFRQQDGDEAFGEDLGEWSVVGPSL